MRLFTILLGFAIFLISGQAASQPALAQTTYGDCSPIVRTQGNVTITCADRKLEERLNGALRTHIQETRQNMDRILATAIVNANKARELSAQQVRNSRTVQEVVAASRRLQSEVTVLQRQAVASVDAFTGSLRAIQNEQQLSATFTSDLIRQVQDDFERDYRDIVLRIEVTEVRLESVEIRIASVEDQVNVVMERFLDGTLQENKYFLGTTLRGGQTKQAGRQSGIALDLELVTTRGPTKFARTSYHIALGGFDLQTTRAFPTQPKALCALTVDALNHAAPTPGSLRINC